VESEGRFDRRALKLLLREAVISRDDTFRAKVLQSIDGVAVVDVSARMSWVSSSWSARLEMSQWIRETLDKESLWDEARSTSLSR
jgi:hypothetical protein